MENTNSLVENSLILQIESILGDSIDVEFKWTTNTHPEHYFLEVYTQNKHTHGEKFLLCKSAGVDKEAALERALKYIKVEQFTEYTYTVQWRMKSHQDLNTSYFRGKTPYEVLDKFYMGKDLTKYIIWSISINPIA